MPTILLGMNIRSFFLFRRFFAHVCVGFFLFLLIWWVKIFFLGKEVGVENYLFNLSYIFFNIVGGVSGLVIARKKWGGFKSAIGLCLSFLGMGLLGQGFGLLVWTYYNLIIHIEVPYPSLADIGYFSLIPFYTLAMVHLARASGAKFGLKSYSGRFQAILVPMGMLGASYMLFIRNVGFDITQPLKTFLDVSYPLGEAMSVSLGLLTLSLSSKYLGGKMRKRVIFIIIALTMQYLTEFTFLYSSGLGIYYNASFVDLMYAFSYCLMTLAIVSFDFNVSQET